MRTTFSLPKHSKVLYRRNGQTGYYQQETPEYRQTPIDRLPLELRRAPAGAANVKVNATDLLLSRECDRGRYRFLTGLQETNFEGWYVGNDFEMRYGHKVLSLLLFHFRDADHLEVYYFYRFDKKSSFYRLQFAQEVIPFLLRGET